ncbi:Structural maintenance of chromosomes protein 3 [Phlyctochytrium bullatum]|nr:Structural maintenance of chromosomes protein 3 [Phlyctochytrium bullatum]
MRSVLPLNWGVEHGVKWEGEIELVAHLEQTKVMKEKLGLCYFLGLAVKGDEPARPFRAHDRCRRIDDVAFLNVVRVDQIDLGEDLQQREALEAELLEAAKRLGSVSLGRGEGIADSQAADPAVLEKKKRELKDFRQMVAASSQSLQDLEVEIEDPESNTGDHHSELEKANKSKKRGRWSIRQQQNLDKYVQRKSFLQRKKEEKTRGIDDLGLLPEEALREDAEMTCSTPSGLLGRPHRVNDWFEKFAHVNKKAF